MPRPREFDTDAVLAGSLKAFWRMGYARTSLSDLEAVTGVGRKGLYNAFGDKRGLFLQVLDRFRATAVARVLKPLQAPGAGRAAIEETLRTMVRISATSEGRNGCLLCNTAQDPIRKDKAVARRLNNYMHTVRDHFAVAIVNAKERGEVDGDADTHALAEFFMGIVIAISVMARSPVERSAIEGVAETALRHLD
jgi:TetR/AcrR family transcriptional regulator, transcriptional repressor for nem operon